MLAVMIPGQPITARIVPVESQKTVISAPSETAPAPEVSDTIEVAKPTVQDVLLNVCESQGYGQDCAKTLLGMLWNESNNISTAIGDKGKARGYFQIWTKLHKISIACAEDLTCSANWSLNYMELHSYPKYVSYAVQCHNTCNAKNGYAARAARNGKNLWDTPLKITQAAPIVLAMN